MARMWLTPSAASRDFQPISGETVLEGLGYLHYEHRNWYHYFIQQLDQRVNAFLEGNPPSKSSHGNVIKRSRFSMKTIFSYIWSCPVSHSQLVEIVVAFQRCFLELVALLDYFEKYKPMMDGETEPEHSECAHVVGAFVDNSVDAQMLFAARIPFWYIAPASELDRVIIRSLGSIVTPSSWGLVLQDLTPPAPPVYSGTVDTLKTHHGILDTVFRKLLASSHPLGAPLDVEKVGSRSVQGSTSSAQEARQKSAPCETVRFRGDSY